MMSKKFTISKIIVALIGAGILTSCTGGIKNNNEDGRSSTTTNANVVKPTPLHMMVSQGSPVGFDNIKLGTGFNPDTKEVYNVSVPDLDELYYLDGTKPVVPISGCNTYEQQDVADEFGKVKSSNLASIFEAEGGGGANYGIAKLKASMKFNEENTSDTGELSISKILGSRLSCTLRTYADPTYSSGKIGLNQYAQALSNANPSIASALSDIRRAKTTAARQAAIEFFYANFGTYMVSSVDLGEIALLKLSMTQQIETSKTKQHVAIASSFSSPFGSVKADVSSSTASQFDMKSWSVHYERLLNPSDTALSSVLDTMKSEIDEFKGNGIIDYANLHPTPVAIDAFEKPDLSKIEISEDGLANSLKAKSLYNSLTYSVPAFLDDLNDFKDLASTKKKAQAPKLISKLEIILSEYSALMTDEMLARVSPLDYIKLKINIIPYITSFKSNDLVTDLKTYITDGDGEAIDVVIDDDIETGAKKEKTEIDANENNKKATAAIEAFRRKYQTISIYYRDYAYEEELKKVSIKSNFPSQSTFMLSVHAGHAMGVQKLPLDYAALRTKYMALYKSLGGNTIKSQLLFSDEDSSAKNKLMSQNLKNTNDDELYKDHVITNFSIISWSKVFPELTETIIDDTDEGIASGLSDIVTQYLEAYRYMALVYKLDANSKNFTSLYIHEQTDIYPFMIALKNGLESIQSGSDDSSNILRFVFKNKTYLYDLSSEDDLAELAQNINTIIEKSFLKETDPNWGKWFQAYEALRGFGYLGTYEPLLAVQPANHEEIYILNNSSSTTVPPLQLNMPSKDYAKRFAYEQMSQYIFSNDYIESSVLEFNLPGSTTDIVSDPFFGRFNYSNNTYMFNYGISGSNSTASAWSRTIPANSAPYYQNGVIPVLLETAYVDHSGKNPVVKNLGLVTSSGHVIGEKAMVASSGEFFGTNTVKYALELEPLLDNNYGYSSTLSSMDENSTAAAIQFDYSMPVNSAVDINQFVYDKIIIGLSGKSSKLFRDYLPLTCSLHFDGWDKTNLNRIYNGDYFYLASIADLSTTLETCTFDTEPKVRNRQFTSSPIQKISQYTLNNLYVNDGIGYYDSNAGGFVHNKVVKADPTMYPSIMFINNPINGKYLLMNSLDSNVSRNAEFETIGSGYYKDTDGATRLPPPPYETGFGVKHAGRNTSIFNVPLRFGFNPDTYTKLSGNNFTTLKLKLIPVTERTLQQLHGKINAPYQQPMLPLY